MAPPEELDAQRRRHPRFQPEVFEHNRSLASAVIEVANERSVAPGQVALAWVLGQGDDVVPIPGTKHIEYLEENVGAVGLELTAEERDRLDGLQKQVLGDRSFDQSAIGREAPLPS